MASFQEISPANLDAFLPLIPDVFQERAADEPLTFYGIEESDEASGVMIFKSAGLTAEIVYIYILPYLRGTGVIDNALTNLFFHLKDTGYSSVTMQFVADEYPVLSNIAKRFEFEQKTMDFAYFRFTAEEIMKCRASSFEPQGVMRVKYLPKDKLERLKKLIDKYIKAYGKHYLDIESALPYSMAYMEGTEPKGALLVDAPSIREDEALGEMKQFPENGAYDITLFFIGTTSQKAPLYLLSGLCKVLKAELPPEAVITGYFPAGHVVKLFENILGVKGHHEVLAKLDLEGF